MLLRVRRVGVNRYNFLLESLQDLDARCVCVCVVCVWWAVTLLA